MVELEELEKKVFSLKHKIAGKKGALKKLQASNDEIKKASRQARNAEHRLNQYKSIRDTYSEGTNEWNKADSNVKRAEQELEKKKQKEEELKAKFNVSKVSALEQELQDLQTELDGVFTELQKDPDFNTDLVVQLENEFNKKINKKGREFADIQKKETILIANLKSDQKYGPLVSELKKVYAELKAYPQFSTDPKAVQAQKHYMELAEELRVKIKADEGFQDFTITDTDLISICNGEFKFEEYENKKSNIFKEKQDLIVAKENAISNVKSLKEGPTSQEMQENLDRIDKAIQDNQTAVQENERKKAMMEDFKTQNGISDFTQVISDEQQEIDRKTQEIQTMETRKAKLDEIKSKRGNSDARIQELLDKKSQSEATKNSLTAELTTKETEYNDALTDLRNSGYITAIALPELNDATSEISKKYEEFFQADYAVRKAFELIETEPTPDSQNELKDAIEKYRDIAQELKRLSGYEVEAWQNYLKKDLEFKCEQDGQIDEVYYSDTMQNKYSRLGKSYKCTDNESYKKAGKNLESLQKAEERILNDNSGLMAIDAFSSVIQDYYDNVECLSSDLRINKDDIYGFLKGTLVNQSKKIWDVVKNFANNIISKFKKHKFKSGVSRPDNLSELESKVVNSRREYKKVQDDLASVTDFTIEEEQELIDLVNDKNDPSIIDNELTSLDSSLQTAESERSLHRTNLTNYQSKQVEEQKIQEKEVELQDEEQNLYQLRTRVLNSKTINKTKPNDPRVVKAAKKRIIDDEGR